MSERAGAGGIIGAIAENIVTLLSTGNCIAYLYREECLSLVSRPDNMEMVINNSLERHFCTSPTSGFGLFDKLYFEISEVRVFEGDLFVICSDGIYSRIGDGEWEGLLERISLGQNHGETVKN